MMANMNLNPEQVISLFPEGKNGEMTDMDRAIIVMTEFRITEEDGKVSISKAGNVIRDEVTLNPSDPKQVIADYFGKRGWVDKLDTLKTGINTLSGFNAEYERRNPGKYAYSYEGQQALESHIARVGIKNFDFYN